MFTSSYTSGNNPEKEWSYFNVFLGNTLPKVPFFLRFQMLPLNSRLHSACCCVPNEIAVFSIWKSLQVLQKAHIKIIAHAIYTYLFFSYTYIFVFCWKIKSCCDHCSSQQIKPLFNDIYFKTILVWRLISMWLTNNTHCL